MLLIKITRKGNFVFVWWMKYLKNKTKTNEINQIEELPKIEK